jgi:hypothetical protein
VGHKVAHVLQQEVAGAVKVGVRQVRHDHGILEGREGRGNSRPISEWGRKE